MIQVVHDSETRNPMNLIITAIGSFVAGIVATFAAAMLLIPDPRPESIADCAYDRLKEYNNAGRLPQTDPMIEACISHSGSPTEAEWKEMHKGLERAVAEILAR